MLRPYGYAAFAVAALLAACSSEPPSGIRVVLDLADPTAANWATAYADHVSVIAEGSDGTRGVACLYPRSTGLASEPTNASGDDPCADRHPSPPALVALQGKAALEDDWSLATRDGVNVLAAKGATVRVRAVAAWGGAALLGRSLAVSAAPASLAADSSFPTLHLSLQRNPRAFVDDCPGLDLSPEPLGSRGEAVDFPPDACPRSAANAARHIAVIATGGGALRIPSDLPPSCGETDAVIAWKTAPLTIPSGSGNGKRCGQLTLEGNFATCAPGTKAGVDCVLSVQCTPPSTHFVLLGGDGRSLARTDQEFGCLPSASGPFTVVTEFAPVNISTVAAAIEQTVPGRGPNTCFLDVKRFAITTVPCGN